MTYPETTRRDHTSPKPGCVIPGKYTLGQNTLAPPRQRHTFRHVRPASPQSWL